MPETLNRACPFCSGDMVRSKSAGQIVFEPPWAGFWKIQRSHRAFPWACLKCGVVLFYLENLPALVRARQRGKRVAAEMHHVSPIKP